MAELPKSVLERLKKQAGAPEHPDTNLLAAFSERALTGRERESVLAHLAVCADCREAVARARIDEPWQPGAVMLPWYRRPQTFTWTAVAATLIVGAALVVNYREKPSSTDAFSRKPGPTTAAVATQPQATQAETKTDRQEIRQAQVTNEQGAPPAQSQLAAPPAKQRQDLVQEHRAGGGAKDLDTKTQANRAQLADKLQAKEEAPKFSVAGPSRDEGSRLKAAATATTPPPQPSAPSNMAAVAREQQDSRATQTGEVESAAQSATHAPRAAVGGLYSVAPLAKGESKEVSAAARWSVSQDGQLQRSMDSGRTWRTITPSKGTTFRAVAMVGSNVWAGGAGATLFYSSDGGQTWSRQLLPDSTATILSLQFDDAQHGVAQCDDGTVWSTDDGGRHWVKR